MRGFRSAPAGKGSRTALLGVTILAVLIMLVNAISGGAISAGVRDVTSPISAFGRSFGFGISQTGYFSTRRSLEAQIAELQNQIQQQQLQAAAFDALQQQNDSLSALTHLAQTTHGLAARVSSSIISSPYGTFTIASGSAEGVVQDAKVLTAGGFVVGIVTQVQEHQSVVSEVFAPDAQTPVTIEGTTALAFGQGGQARADVPHGASVKIGDPVLAPAYGGRPIGTVAHVDANPANAQQAVYISLPVSLSALQYVYVAL